MGLPVFLRASIEMTETSSIIYIGSLSLISSEKLFFERSLGFLINGGNWKLEVADIYFDESHLMAKVGYSSANLTVFYSMLKLMKNGGLLCNQKCFLPWEIGIFLAPELCYLRKLPLYIFPLSLWYVFFSLPCIYSFYFSTLLISRISIYRISRNLWNLYWSFF